MEELAAGLAELVHDFRDGPMPASPPQTSGSFRSTGGLRLPGGEPLVDIERVLLSLLPPEASGFEDPDSPLQRYPLGEAPAAHSAHRGLNEPPYDWLLQLSHRSSTACLLETARSGPGASAAHPVSGRLPPLSSSRAPTQATLQVQNLLEFDDDLSSVFDPEEGAQDIGSVAETEYDDGASSQVVSVFDVSDDALYRDRGEGVPWSTAASTTSLRSPHRPFSSGSLLGDRIATFLRRLALEGTAEEIATNGTARRPPDGLTDEELRALPQVLFGLLDPTQCAICLETYEVGELLTALRCSHLFHGSCLALWAQRAGLCPLCRTPCGGVEPEKLVD